MAQSNKRTQDPEGRELAQSPQESNLKEQVRKAIVEPNNNEVSTADIAVGMLSSTDVSTIVWRIEKILAKHQQALTQQEKDHELYLGSLRMIGEFKQWIAMGLSMMEIAEKIDEEESRLRKQDRRSALQKIREEI